jgi:site-specific DNA-cytosine methylase
MKRVFKILSICGGIGMGSEAIKQAIIDSGCEFIEIACVDFGELQEFVYYKNHAEGLYCRIDIRELTLEVLNAFLISKGRDPIQKQEIDLILFSTSCTFASGLNNYRTPYHEINQLTTVEIPRILREFEPKVGFIAENVGDIVTDTDLRPMFIEFKRALNSHSMYDFKYDVLNSADYNCWTSRPRLIILGKAKSIPGEITFPEPTTTNYSNFHLNKLIPTALAYNAGLYRYDVIDPETNTIIGKEDKWLSADRIIGTVTATGGEGILDSDYDEPRSLSIGELKKLFGIEHFDFGNLSDRDIHFLIGNGIVVPFMKVVCRHFLDQFCR